MVRISRLSFLVLASILASGGFAQAQSMAGTTKQRALATPPPGMVAPVPKKLNHMNASNPGDNIPTLPEIALHPGATIGSPSPMAGPGGTASHPVGD